jgi:hypothetical protein
MIMLDGNNDDSKLERVTTKCAASELRMDLDTLQYMMQQNRLPIGHAIKKEGKKRWSYYIYRGLLDDYVSFLNGKSDADRFRFLYGSPKE